MVSRSRKTVHLKLGMIPIEGKIHFTHLFKIEWQTWCQVATRVERSILIPVPKKGSTKECSNHQTIAFISCASKVTLKILHARLQHYVNQELPGIQAGFRKGRGTRKQIANIHWIIEKAREFQKNIYLRFINYAKALDCGDHNKQWKALKKMGIPDHYTCLLRNLYVDQEATVRTGHGTTHWIKIRKGICQGFIVTLLI